MESFVSESVRRNMRIMGFSLDTDVSTDYMMTLTITDYNLSFLSGVGWSAVIKMDIQVQDKNLTPVYPTVNVTGRFSEHAGSSDFATATRVLNKAYQNALEDIDWDRIAFFLKKSDNAALEKTSKWLETAIQRWNLPLFVGLYNLAHKVQMFIGV